MNVNVWVNVNSWASQSQSIELINGSHSETASMLAIEPSVRTEIASAVHTETAQIVSLEPSMLAQTSNATHTETATTLSFELSAVTQVSNAVHTETASLIAISDSNKVKLESIDNDNLVFIVTTPKFELINTTLHFEMMES